MYTSTRVLKCKKDLDKFGNSGSHMAKRAQDQAAMSKEACDCITGSLDVLWAFHGKHQEDSLLGGVRASQSLSRGAGGSSKEIG